jgi:hypothetical protein
MRRPGCTWPTRWESSCSAASGPETDARDSTNLADLLGMGRLPEVWLAPPQVQELREPVRYRAKLVALCSGLKAQVHAVLAKEGVRVPMSGLFGIGGTGCWTSCSWGVPMGSESPPCARFLGPTTRRWLPCSARSPPCWPAMSASWPSRPSPGGAGAGGRLRGRDRRRRPLRRRPTAVLLGRAHPATGSPIPPCAVARSPKKQGPGWAAVQATQRLPTASKQATDFHRIADRRGTGIGRVAAARKLLTLICHGLRDGQVR